MQVLLRYYYEIQFLNQILLLSTIDRLMYSELKTTQKLIDIKHYLALVNTVSLYYSLICIFKFSCSLKCLCNS